MYSKILSDFTTIDLDIMRPNGFLEKSITKSYNNHNNVIKKSGCKSVEYCPICRCRNSEIELNKFNINILTCKNCSLRFSAYVPNNIEDIYSSQNYFEHSKDVYLNKKDYRINRFGIERLDLIKRFVGYCQNKKLLDVGCGTGWFLEIAKQNGFSIYGIEAGGQLAKLTAERLNTDIWNCSLEELNTNIKFDVITMFDLIEHVYNPVSLLISAKKLLAEEGIIVVFTPNFDSLAISIMGERSSLIMPFEHLTYFNYQSLKYMVKNINMNLAYYETKGIDMGDLKSYYEMLGEDDMAKYCDKFYDIIQPVIDASGAGNHMRFILTTKK